MFYFRINKIKISDTKENSCATLNGTEKSPLKFISFIITENTILPDMSGFLQCKDVNKKKALLQKAVQTVVSTSIFTEIDNVNENKTFTFDNHGLVLFQSDKIPEEFDWQFIAFESNQNIKECTQMFENIVNDKDFDNFTQNLSGIIRNSCNPSHSAAVSIARYAINVTNKIASQNHQELLGISETSLNRRQHYIYGGRKKDRISDLTNNISIDYSIFGYDE
jgi:hypothetical protein